MQALPNRPWPLLCVATLLLAAGCASTGPASAPPDTSASGNRARPALTAAQRCDIAPALSWMEQQHIPYTQTPSDEWRDCSGNFLRLSSRIATICPDVTLAAPGGVRRYDPTRSNKRPGPEAARTTRGLANWYDQQGSFIPIFYDRTDPLDAPPALQKLRNRIRPGTVLWYSPEVPLASAGKDGLYREVGGVINHMGTVVDVTRDTSGNVTGWTMYHGQNARKHNGITQHLWARSGRSRPVPQGGYGSQRIVGFAEHIVPGAVIAN